MNEYEEWSKIKFIITKEDNYYRIVSVDFGAIPIVVEVPIYLGIKYAKLKTLKKLNSYNSILRWTENTVGDKKGTIKEIKYYGRKRRKYIKYRFKANKMSDLKFIDNVETIETSKQTTNTK